MSVAKDNASATSTLLARNAAVLRARVSKHAWGGMAIGVLAAAIATLLVCYLQNGAISLMGLVNAQRGNIALWFLDFMPLTFAFWGQYVSYFMAYQAGALLADQTEELRKSHLAAELRAQRSARHDPLTGLPNRQAFREQLGRAIDKLGEKRRRIGVLMIDLDDFKEINEVLGHVNGDKVLKTVAGRLTESARTKVTPARVGSNEFAVLVDSIESAKPLDITAQELASAVSKPMSLEGLQFTVRATIGAAIFPDHGIDVDNLLRRADIAMYAAKRSQRPYRLYRREMDRRTPERLKLMGDLRSGIEENQLLLRLQPIADCESKEIVALEALMRWRHPERSLLLASDFLPLAEQIGMAPGLIQWLLDQALLTGSRLAAEGHMLDISVPLSRQCLHEKDFAAQTAKLLQRHAYPASRLLLEVNPESLFNEPEQAFACLQQLTALGLRVSIADYGQSGLRLIDLQRMPVAELKIAAALVSQLGSDPIKKQLVASAIATASSLNIRAVAKGVATRAVAQPLKEMRCHRMQGACVGNAMDADQIQGWLAEQNGSHRMQSVQAGGALIDG